MINADLALFIAFIAIVAILLYHDRKKVKLQGVMFIRRTQKGRAMIDKITQISPKFWHFLGILGIIICIPALLLGTYFLLSNSVAIAQGTQQEGVRLVLPSPTNEVSTNQPGFLLLPWWVWLLGIISVVVPHELFHGIMCRTDKIRIQSVGWILLAIIPGAFVEPDEKQLKRAKRTTKLKVYAAGSFANFIMAFLVLLLLIVSFSALFQPTGTAFTANETSVFGKNVTGVILSIDGRTVSNPEDFRQLLARYKPGDTANIVVAENYRFVPAFSAVAMVDEKNVSAYSVTFDQHPEEPGRPYMGLLVSQTIGVEQNDLGFSLYGLFFWIFVLNLGIGIVNILPIKPLDGGLFFEEIVGKFFKNPAPIVKGVSILVVLLLVFNLLGPIFL